MRPPLYRGHGHEHTKEVERIEKQAERAHEETAMNTTQSWAGLPEHIKRQAAPDMLAGKGWYFYGCKIEHPGADELSRWAGLAPQSPQAGAESAGSITAEPGISARIAHTRAREGKPMTRQQKRDAVDQALSRNVNVPDRELARSLAVSHTFIALRRRKTGNVAGL